MSEKQSPLNFPTIFHHLLASHAYLYLASIQPYGVPILYSDSIYPGIECQIRILLNNNKFGLC